MYSFTTDRVAPDKAMLLTWFSVVLFSESIGGCDMVTGAVYKIVNIKDGHVYVGSACVVEQRWMNHRTRLRANNHHSIRLQRAWNRDGELAFEFSIIEHVNALNKLTLREKIVRREQHWIDALGGYGLIGYNMSPNASSTLGTIRSTEYRAKMAKSRQGIKLAPWTQERRENMIRKLTGQKRGPMPEAQKLAISRGNKGKPKPPGFAENISSMMKGRKYGPMSETRKNILRNALIGRTKITEAGREKLRQLAKEKWARRDGSIGFLGERTPEIREKISIAQRGKKISDECRQKISSTKQRKFREKLRHELQAELF